MTHTHPSLVLKHVLAKIIPDLKPTHRLEYYAQSLGYKTYAAFQTSQKSGPTGLPLRTPHMLFERGMPLPLLVEKYTNRVTVSPEKKHSTLQSPDVDIILGVAFETYGRPLFGTLTIQDTFSKASALPDGPLKWYFVNVVINNACQKHIDINGKGDTFWNSKAQLVLAGILMFPSLHNVLDTETLNFDDFQQLVLNLKISPKTTYQNIAYEELEIFIKSPDKTGLTILYAAQDLLKYSQTSVDSLTTPSPKQKISKFL